jgi:hypothetical protein
MSDDDFAPIGPNSLVGTPDQHFDTLLYKDAYSTGNPNIVGGLNFKPDLIWIKCRDAGESHSLVDTVRGVGKRIMADSSAAEGAVGTGPTELTEDGFVGGTGYGSDGDSSGHRFAVWCWKAGNGTVQNRDGTHPTTVSVNNDAGFSIITYTGDVSGTAVQETVGHGLGVTPEFVIIKDRTNTTNWRVYHKGLAAFGATATANTLHLNTMSVAAGAGARVADVNATTITLGGGTDDGGGVIGNDRQHVAYCWHSVEGFSKFGSYEGNNNANGPFIYLGFKPAFIIIRSIEGGNREWMMMDNKRSTFNPIDRFVQANSAGAETTAYASPVDFLSNGFKLRCDEGNFNNSETHLYMAWAEMPFKYATAR